MAVNLEDLIDLQLLKYYDTKIKKWVSINAGSGGGSGEAGKDGVSPTISIDDITGGHKVTITDVNGAHAFNVMDGTPGAKGADGTPGADGADGEDGFSPSLKIESIEGGHKVTVTDVDGSKSFQVLDGVKGSDGTSPTVAVESIENGHQVTITDSNGSKSFNVMNGEQGPKGDAASIEVDGSLEQEDGALRVAVPVQSVSKDEFEALPPEEKAKGLIFVPDAESNGGGSGGGFSEEVYSTEETRIGTWLDNDFFRRVFILPYDENKRQIVSLGEGSFTVVRIYGYLKNRSVYQYPLYYYPYSDITQAISCFAYNGSIYIDVGMDSIANDDVIYVVAEYTKTTD